MSIERLLNHSFQENEPVPGNTTRAVLARTNDLELKMVGDNIGSPALSIFLYRVDFNKTMRVAWSGVASQTGRTHLPVDIHFLISPCAENSEFELRVLGKAMECLETTPILSGPLLHSSSVWASNEAIQIVLEEVGTEAVMRIFDSLPTDYRLSVPYIARIVRIDSPVARPTSIAMNEFLSDEWTESLERLALGLEPVDAELGTRVAYPIRIIFDDTVRGLPRPRVE